MSVPSIASSHETQFSNTAKVCEFVELIFISTDKYSIDYIFKYYMDKKLLGIDQ